MHSTKLIKTSAGRTIPLTNRRAASHVATRFIVPRGHSDLASPSTSRPKVGMTPPKEVSKPKGRLDLISRHFSSHPQIPLNTPFSIERQSSHGDDIDEQPPPKAKARQPGLSSKIQTRDFSTQTINLLPKEEKKVEAEKEVATPAVKEEPTKEVKEEEKPATPSPKMSSQPPHPALLIPGPIEFDDAVLQSMSHYSESHVGQPFVNCFGETLSMLRKLFQTTNEKSQPFVISGSGTLGWDQVASNLAEPGDDVLVLHTGYFADSFADCFEAYGVKATQLKAPIGERPQLDEVEKALSEKKYKLITVTHTDTSTGVLSEIESLSKLVHKVSPETLVVVDGVCSVGGEDIQFDNWGIDVVITASQKAIGAPAGLSILMASGRAIETFKARKTPPAAYFASWKNWLPIMQNYEARKPSYFATPSPQLVHALHTALTQLLSRPLEERFRIHKEQSRKIKKFIEDLGLKQLASKPENQANCMTAIYLPEGFTPPDVLPKLLSKGVIFAGGLHKEIASKYIRFGHMGVSVTDPSRNDVDRALQALKEGLIEVGYKA